MPHRLLDFGYFLSKTVGLMPSKLKLFFHLLETEDVEEACKKIQADAQGYKRICIWKRVDGGCLGVDGNP